MGADADLELLEVKDWISQIAPSSWQLQLEKVAELFLLHACLQSPVLLV